MTDRSLIVFPVGHFMGERHPESHHVVRVGLAHRALSQDEFGVWVLAHGTEETGRGAWTVGDLLELAERAALSGPADAVERMVDSGLLATVGAAGDGPRRFAEQYRIHSLLVGLGNSDTEPDRYEVGLPGLAPVAVLNSTAYELWQWGHLTPNLWRAGEVREKVAARLGEQAPADLLGDLLGDLRLLLIHTCAYLDLARVR